MIDPHPAVRRRTSGFAAALLVALLCQAFPPAAGASTLHVVDLEGGLGPATADFVIRSLDAAQQEADFFMIRMDTPGGLDKSMRDIIKAILASRIPVITYVAPEGSRAASAGTYILYASHVAAMAPATNLGSATPVSIGGVPTPPGDRAPAAEPAAEPEPAPPPEADGTAVTETGTDGGRGDGAAPADAPALETAMERKVVNDAAAYIRSLAELRGRNADWAEAAVRKAANLSASEALERNVIDLVATSIEDVMRQIDGRVVEVDDTPLTLDTSELEITEIETDWRHDLLATITDPSVAYLLLIAGAYGLLLEFYNPGFGVAGITGAICLLLGAYALQMLPINYAGLGLIALGLALMVAEALTPTLGVLGGGGLIAFVIGSVVLMDTDLPGYQISVWLIGGTAVLSLLVLTVALAYLLRSRRRPVVTGEGGFVQAQAAVLHDFRTDSHAPDAARACVGSVQLHGEIWRARSDRPLKAGDRVEVTARDGMELLVTPLAPGAG